MSTADTPTADMSTWEQVQLDDTFKRWTPELEKLCSAICNGNPYAHIRAPHASGKSTMIPRFLRGKLDPNRWNIVHAACETEAPRLGCQPYMQVLQALAQGEMPKSTVVIVDLTASGSADEEALLVGLADKAIPIVTMSVAPMPSSMRHLFTKEILALPKGPLCLLKGPPQRRSGWSRCADGKAGAAVSEAIKQLPGSKHLVLCMGSDFPDAEHLIQHPLPGISLRNWLIMLEHEQVRIVNMQAVLSCHARDRIQGYDYVHVILTNITTRLVFDRLSGHHGVELAGPTTLSQRLEMISYGERCDARVTFYSTYDNAAAFVDAATQAPVRRGFDSLHLVAATAQVGASSLTLSRLVPDEFELMESCKLLRHMGAVAWTNEMRLVLKANTCFTDFLAVVGNPRLALLLSLPSTANVAAAKVMASALLTVGLGNIFILSGPVQDHVRVSGWGLAKNMATRGTLWALMSIGQYSEAIRALRTVPIFIGHDSLTMTKHCHILPAGTAAVRRLKQRLGQVMTAHGLPYNQEPGESDILTTVEADTIERQLLQCFPDRLTLVTVTGGAAEEIADLYSGETLKPGQTIENTVNWTGTGKVPGLYLGGLDRSDGLSIDDWIMLSKDDVSALWNQRGVLRSKYKPRWNPEDNYAQ
ncbi:hypothetical protein B0I35DRAFT_482149 [Stachybotrys elegans]|uniref:Uncharacterized protein n=1 Tax=Stachybotrys elegans TaxID=80388 RepID=A0A8K0SKT6_9HYPO|nr:hypothetical protein B0I35DRAFT_482149 [Stachybotrys elegans]